MSDSLLVENNYSHFRNRFHLQNETEPHILQIRTNKEVGNNVQRRTLDNLTQRVTKS